MSKEKNKKASTLLCAKKHNKKKKKKAPYSAYSDGSYPLYSSTIDGEYHFIKLLKKPNIKALMFFFFLNQWF